MANKKEKEVDVQVEEEKEINEPWEPFRVPAHLENAVLDATWVHPWMRKRGWRSIWPGLWYGKDVKEVPIDFKDTEKQYEIYAEVPGVSKDNIEVHVTPHDLAIKGTVKRKKKLENEDYLWKERGYSIVARAVHFPNEVIPDNAEAELEDGVLKVIVPKKKITLKEKGKRILIKQK